MTLSYSFSGTCLVNYEAPHLSPLPSSSNLNPTSLSPFVSTSGSSPTITLFTLLPLELRLKIWSLTIRSPRLVPLNYLSSTARITTSTLKSHRGCTSTASIPIALHICHESRTLALQHYALSFGLSGGISYPGTTPSPLPSKIYFSAEKGDVLYFTLKEGWNAGIQQLIYACMMVHPGESGFRSVKRLAAHESLFVRRGKGSVELNIRYFWECVKSKFTGLEEVLFVESGEDALVAFEERNTASKEKEEGGLQINGLCYADDEFGVGNWEKERFEEKVERFVRSLEGETGWVAPRWRVVMHGRESRESKFEGMVIERQMRKEKEEALARNMRELFGHEDVSNAF